MMLAGLLRNRYNAESSVCLARAFWKDIISDIKLNMLPALEILLWWTYSKELSKEKVKKLTQRCLWLYCVWGEWCHKRMRVGWHHWLDEFEQTPGDSEGQGSLACCSPWVHRESDTTEWLDNMNKLWGKTKHPKWPKQKKNHHSLKKNCKYRKCWERSKNK